MSWPSIGKSISTQPTTSGARTGTSTAWYGRPARKVITLAWPEAADWVESRSASGTRWPVSRVVVARRLKSVASRATSVAPIRAPWLASTETMVSASFELTASRKP